MDKALLLYGGLCALHLGCIALLLRSGKGELHLGAIKLEKAPSLQKTLACSFKESENAVIFNNTITTLGGFSQLENGPYGIVLDTNGNVGIGTSTPSKINRLTNASGIP